MEPEKMMFLLGAAVVLTVGWVVTTWLRMRHGYPLESMMTGKPIEPAGGGKTAERLQLLTAENAQLRAELGSVKDRLATVERIVTDRGVNLAVEIDGLRTPLN